MNRRSTKPKSNTNRRRGAIAVLSCTMMIVLMSMLAFCIDLGYVANSQAELQRSADASALAACYRLMYKGTPSTTIDVSSNIAAAPTVASQFAALNPVCKTSPALTSTDVVVGRIANPLQWGGTISTSGPTSQYNAVQVTVQRTAEVNGLVPTFFGRVLGINGNPITSTATAAFAGQLRGFTTPKSSSGSECVMILPFTLDWETWDCYCKKLAPFTDKWSCSSQPGMDGSVQSLSKGNGDGTPEIDLFPHIGNNALNGQSFTATGSGTQFVSAGNRGTVNIGVNPNSTATMIKQILYGISATDLSYHGGSLLFDDDGEIELPGDPGISAGFSEALKTICGQCRIIPIFSKVEGSGDTCRYTICAFLGCRVIDVNLTGSLKSKYLTIQPEYVITKGGVNSTSSSSTHTYGVYSPVILVR